MEWQPRSLNSRPGLRPPADGSWRLPSESLSAMDSKWHAWKIFPRRPIYTRGAFYANFEDKEDIFFAILERYVAERIEEMPAPAAQES